MRIGWRGWGIGAVALAALTWQIWVRAEPSFYYEFGVDLSYDGQPLTISRVVECVPPNVGRRTFPAMGRSQEAIAEQLADGSGLIVVIPSLCDPETWPLSPEYVPLILWTEEIENPQLLEAYLSEALLRSGNARITLHKAFARQSSSVNFVGASRDFVLFAYSSLGDVFRDYHTKGKRYVGLTARTIARDEWMKEPRLVSALSAVETPGPIPRGISDTLNQKFPYGYDWFTLNPNPKNNMPRRRPTRQEALDKQTPLRWIDSAFESDMTHPGIALVYPVDKIPTINLVVAERHGVTVITRPQPSDANYEEPKSLATTWPMRVHSTTLEIGANHIYFEPTSQTIFAIQQVDFTLFDKPE